MKKPHHPNIRALLRANPDGLTARQIRDALAIPKVATVRGALETMPDVYVDRWTDPVRGQWQAVWCAVVPPSNCPYPTDRFEAPKTVWRPVKSHA